MTHHVWSPNLLADRGATMFRNMGEGFRQNQQNFNPAELLLWMLLLVGLFIGLNKLSRYLSQNGKRRVIDSPRALFRALCRAHELDWTSRRRLQRLAAERRLPSASQLFLRPECFEAAGLSAAWTHQLPALQALRERLFGIASPATEDNVDAVYASHLPYDAADQAIVEFDTALADEALARAALAHEESEIIEFNAVELTAAHPAARNPAAPAPVLLNPMTPLNGPDAVLW